MAYFCWIRPDRQPTGNDKIMLDKSVLPNMAGVTEYQAVLLQHMQELYPELEPADYPSVSVQDRKINCGKPQGSTCEGKNYKHGAEVSYQYAFWRDPKTKKVITLYLGRVKAEPTKKSLIREFFRVLMSSGGIKHRMV